MPTCPDRSPVRARHDVTRLRMRVEFQEIERAHPILHAGMILMRQKDSERRISPCAHTEGTYHQLTSQRVCRYWFGGAARSAEKKQHHFRFRTHTHLPMRHEQDRNRAAPKPYRVGGLARIV